MNAGGLRAVIADDHPMFREGLRKLLESEMGIEVCAEADDARSAVAAVTQHAPELLLLDLEMPRDSGLEVLRLIVDEAVPTRTIVVAATIRRIETVQALQLGARGVVLKSFASQVLFESIDAVLAGDFWLESERLPNQEDALRKALRRGGEPLPAFSLTPREQEVIAALVDGLGNRDIAQRLRVSEVTVKHHLASIFNKTGCSNRVEVTLFALRRGLARL